MQCQFTLKAIRNSMLICSVLGGVASSGAYAAESIENIFYKAEIMLKRNPAQLSELREYKADVFQKLRGFLDRNNTESYVAHIGYLEDNVRCLDARFIQTNSCIKSLAQGLHREMRALLDLLRKYIGTRSYAKLGYEIIQFKHLLPKVIIAEVGGEFALLGLLDYRMSC